MSHPYPPRPCPICSECNRELLFEQRFEVLANISLMAGYDVVACRRCGLVYADHIPPKETFDHYYANASKYEFSHQGGQQHRFEIERLAALAEWIATHVPTSSRLLDAGCATGELLVQLRQKGFSSLTGLDPSAACVEYARKHNGLRMIQGVFGQKPADEPAFDVVVLSAVLEHIPDLQPIVEQLKKWLTPSGYLIIEVPDAEHFADGFNAPYQEFSVEHINFFSAPSLSNLMRMNGLKTIATRKVICPAGVGVTGSVLTMIFQAGPCPAEIEFDTLSEAGVRNYLRFCKKWVDREQQVIQELVATQKPILVWGTGTLCQRLLATTRLGSANINAFVDSNPHYQGKQLVGRPIIAPNTLTTHPEPILITSWTFFEEITRQIRHDLMLTNEIIKIHEVPS